MLIQPMPEEFLYFMNVLSRIGEVMFFSNLLSDSNCLLFRICTHKGIVLVAMLKNVAYGWPLLVASLHYCQWMQ